MSSVIHRSLKGAASIFVLSVAASAGLSPAGASSAVTADTPAGNMDESAGRGDDDGSGVTRRIHFGRFGVGLRPEDWRPESGEEQDGVLIDPISGDALRACIGRELAIREGRSRLAAAVALLAQEDEELDRMESAISGRRTALTGGNAPASAVRSFNEDVEAYNQAAARNRGNIEEKDAIRTGLERILVSFNLECAGRPFNLAEADAIRSESRTGGEGEAARASIPALSDEEGWAPLMRVDPKSAEIDTP